MTDAEIDKFVAENWRLMVSLVLVGVILGMAFSGALVWIAT